MGNGSRLTGFPGVASFHPVPDPDYCWLDGFVQRRHLGNLLAWAMKDSVCRSLTPAHLLPRDHQISIIKM